MRITETITIYADVLLILNLCVNYLLLLSMAAIIHNKPPFIRLLLSSIFGALTSFVILLPPMNIIISVIFKVSVSAIMVFIAFRITSLKKFLKYTGIFYAVTFVYCGIMTVIFNIFTPRSLCINNTAVYIDISPVLLIISTAICYIIIKLISKLAGKIKSEKEIYEIEIFKGKNSVKCRATLDTGCNIYDPFTGNSVIIMSDELTMPLVSENILRLIPCKTVNGKGTMKSFVPDKAIISQKKKSAQVKNITVAISHEGINDDYFALIGEDVAELL